MTYRVELAVRAIRDLIDERRQTVWVLTIRHGARRKVKAFDLG